MPLITSPLSRMLAASSTNAAPRVTEGFTTLDALRTLLGTDADGCIIGCGRAGREQYKGIALWPFGTDAANETGVLHVFRGLFGAGGKELKVEALGDLTVTLGTLTGAAGRPIIDTELIADTLVWAGLGHLATLEAAASSPGAQTDSPADNTEGLFVLPDFGMDSDLIIIDPDLTTAASLNCLYKLFT